MSTRARIRRVLLGAATVLMVVTAQAVTAPARAATGDATPPGGHGRFVSLNQAVAEHAVDAFAARLVERGRTTRVLVWFNEPSTVTSSANIASRLRAWRVALASPKKDLVIRGGARIVRNLDYVPTTIVDVSNASALLALANSRDVAAVRADQPSQLASMDPVSSALVRQPQAAAAGYTGAGTYVAVLDTGTDDTLPDFGSCTANFVPDTCRVGDFEIAPDDGSLDDDGHGTNVAGIVAGMAPAARILSMDVFTRQPDGENLAYASDVVTAVNQLITWKGQGENIVSANMSFGGTTEYTGDCPDYDGVGALRMAGILPVVASGNHGWTTGLSSPACAPGALSVGAVYDSNLGTMIWSNCIDQTTAADQPTCFSDSGPNLDMLAPGSEITAAGLTYSGTSQATPHVSGAAAVLAAAVPSATVDQIQQALTGSGPLVKDRDGVQRHRLDLVSSLATLAAITTPPVVSVPTFVPRASGTAGANAIPYTFSWSATDADGVASYDAYLKTNGGALTALSIAPSATSATLGLAPGKTYQLAVDATDTKGNKSPITYGAVFTVGSYAETSSHASYTGTWTKQRWSQALGRGLKVTLKRHASVSFTFSGASFVWVAEAGPRLGKAAVYVDGVRLANANLHARSIHARRMVMVWTGPPGIHTVKIVNQATVGHPKIDIDDFVTTR